MAAISLEICCGSTEDELWRQSTAAEGPRRVMLCPIPRRDYFQSIGSAH